MYVMNETQTLTQHSSTFNPWHADISSQQKGIMLYKPIQTNSIPRDSSNNCVCLKECPKGTSKTCVLMDEDSIAFAIHVHQQIPPFTSCRLQDCYKIGGYIGSNVKPCHIPATLNKDADVRVILSKCISTEEVHIRWCLSSPQKWHANTW